MSQPDFTVDELYDAIIDMKRHLQVAGFNVLKHPYMQSSRLDAFLQLTAEMPDDLRESFDAAIIIARGFRAFMFEMEQAEAALVAKKQQQEGAGE